MSNTVIKVENLSKLYRLGEVGTGTITHDLNRWWARVRGKEDPFTKVGATNDRTQAAMKGEHVYALKDINFEVKQGEVLGIIGKNGAGKSTLLKILSRITSPTTGHIKAKGRIASLLEVGTGFHQEMTGRENVYLNGTILGMTKREIDVKFEEIMDFAGCLKYSDTPVKRYSSGMKVRLGFAVAAFLEPEILIVDEVLAVGDAEFQKKAIGKMQDISSGGGRTVLFVSHNMASIESLCARCLLLNNGIVKLNGDTTLVINEYKNTQMTFSEGKLALREDRNGNGKILVSKINFIDPISKKEMLSLKSGQDTIVEVYYSGKLDKIINAKLGLAIFDKNDNFLTVLNTTFDSKFSSGAFPSKGKLTCLIPRLPLTGGHYYITFTLKLQNELVDQVKNALSFHVEDGDFYGTGQINKSAQQGVYINQEWS